jgi:hypothetical protein
MLPVSACTCYQPPQPPTRQQTLFPWKAGLPPASSPHGPPAALGRPVMLHDQGKVCHKAALYKLRCGGRGHPFGTKVHVPPVLWPGDSENGLVRRLHSMLPGACACGRPAAAAGPSCGGTRHAGIAGSSPRLQHTRCFGASTSSTSATGATAGTTATRAPTSCTSVTSGTNQLAWSCHGPRGTAGPAGPHGLQPARPTM